MLYTKLQYLLSTQANRRVHALYKRHVKIVKKKHPLDITQQNNKTTNAVQLDSFLFVLPEPITQNINSK